MTDISSRNRIRHLKCDEEKPICRRCREDRMKCDGYAPSVKASSQPYTNTKAESLSLIAVDHEVSNTALERHYFYHFCHWTCKQLSNSSDTSNFWMQYVLPLSHTSDPVRHAITAVGAAHRFFTAGSDTHSLQHMQVLTKQYNKAISQIIPCLTVSSIHNIHCTLVCCLLFIAFESILGRYSECVRHLRAGNQLLTLPILAAGGKNCATTEKLKEMLSSLSVEASTFMDDNIISDEQRIWVTGRAKDTSNLSSGQFRDLDQAASELRELEVQFTISTRLYRDEASSDNELPAVESEDGEITANDRAMDALFEDLQRRFKKWIARFDLTKRALEYEQHPHMRSQQFLNLTLAQKFWSMNLYFVPEPCLDSTADFLDAAENLVKSLAKPSYFTFSLDGDLISGLSFVVRVCSDADKRDRALTLLQSLNRREGFWDSREIAKMHQVTLSFDDFESWYEMEVLGGVPGYLAKLAEVLKRTK
ncbi:hypothetical protein BKA60DRAFT_652701 [Fusarium oxysporum]|nr:hypothetical protein BKA60DRAFT_652701 [Fusarium oxysporum]